MRRQSTAPAGAVPGGTAHAAAEDTRSRLALEAAWLVLTRTTLPALAVARGWPVTRDHCFQRILLDHASGGRWYDHITARPAYRHATDVALARAVALGEAAVAGALDMAALNRQSLAWRDKLGTVPLT